MQEGQADLSALEVAATAATASLAKRSPRRSVERLYFNRVNFGDRGRREVS